MIFFFIGMPFVFVIGLSIGICSTMFSLILFLCYANNIPLTKPMHIGVEMFLQMSKFWFRLRRKPFRITKNMFEQSMSNLEIKNIKHDITKEKYPYVRILPTTKPTQQAQFWDDLLYKEKEKNFIAELKKPYKSSRISKLRAHMQFSEPMFTMVDNNTTINVEIIKNIACHWIEYQGASIDNGVILCSHGGGYVAGMPSMQYNLCSYLSKLTGCICLSVDYKLCPEGLITDCVNDVFDVYKYLIQEHMVKSKRIAIMGESAGGGLSLLLLQKIRDYNNNHENTNDDTDNKYLGNPGCCWVNSPWTDLSMETESCLKNNIGDAMLVNDPNKYFQRMAVGEIDINAKKRRSIKSMIQKGNYSQKSTDEMLKDPSHSPLYGEWNDLCPIYFMVGATEMLVDDTLKAAKKAYDCGVKIKVDIEPFMHHTWPLFLRTLPEAQYAVVRASDFIMEHLSIS
mmetsp:Transcript_44247/g.39488  ORF Transcript_44247/g.39488 Transcript_44247/m.39488 type:complete len:454 (-) Transcript_44247:772-2133(-)